jgi:hypothetical protein
MLVLLGFAQAQPSSAGSDGDRPPRGPFVDFCPTPEQVEEHLAEYGFDYKPTVPCTNGVQQRSSNAAAVNPDPPEQGAANESDPEAKAREKAFLKSLRRGPETDGNPATIEGIAPDGEEVTIIIQTSNPELFRGMTPAEWAEKVYP